MVTLNISVSLESNITMLVSFLGLVVVGSYFQGVTSLLLHRKKTEPETVALLQLILLILSDCRSKTCYTTAVTSHYEELTA